MKTKLFTILAVIVLFGVCPARADIVELNLFDIGCRTEFNWDSPYWQAEFNLGVEFLEISHVYMDWSGEITAGLAIRNDNPDEPFPLDVGIGASLGSNPWPRISSVYGGG